MSTPPTHQPRTPAHALDSPGAGALAVRGGMWRILGYGGTLALGLVSAAILYRHLGIEDTGRWVVILSLLAIASGLSDAGLTVIAVRELAVREGEERRRMMGAILGLRIALTVVGVTAAVAFAWVAGYGSTLVAGAVLVGVGSLLVSVQVTLAASLMSRLRLGWVAAAEVLGQLVGLALVLALVSAGARLPVLFAIPALAALLPLTLIAFLVRGDVSIRPSFDRRGWSALATDVVPFSLASAAHVLYFRVAIVITSLAASAEQTGYFAASFRVVEALVAVPALLVGAAFPILARAARDDRDRLGRAVGSLLDCSLILGAWMGLCLVLAAPLVIQVLAGEGFEPSVLVLRLQAVAVAGACVSAVLGYTMLSLRLYREALVATTLALGLASTLTVILAATNGAAGAGLATAIGEVALIAAGAAVLLGRRSELRFSLAIVPKVALATCAAALVVLVPWLGPLGLVAGATALYAAVLFLTGAVPPELRAVIRPPYLARAPTSTAP